ncbi:four helix bundle protein [Oscillatoria sp. FACHB-1406]|uniref:four helix bundle protein n=1 Tax=Oscillatoria sp. FACHB-1406 TaxID=2692846 RepID=UPI0016834589|nr:four helix bundle protein [Oscillatoria sp. FACHB-1406]MBD2578101.1 four helix bundle protein [Oscillatoria sp. FACHB-1406]
MYDRSISDRTKQFAVRIVKACSFIDEQSGASRTLAKQLLRSGTSIGANVREAQSAQSDRDFLHKLEIALKEARETQYWLEILIEAEVVSSKKFSLLLQEANEIGKILVVSTQKIKKKIADKKTKNQH